jgi:hypothetical protein
MYESQFIPQIKLYIRCKDPSPNHTEHKNTPSVKIIEYLKAKRSSIYSYSRNLRS